MWFGLLGWWSKGWKIILVSILQPLPLLMLWLWSIYFPWGELQKCSNLEANPFTDGKESNDKIRDGTMTIERKRENERSFWDSVVRNLWLDNRSRIKESSLFWSLANLVLMTTSIISVSALSPCSVTAMILGYVCWGIPTVTSQSIFTNSSLYLPLVCILPPFLH